MLDGMKLITAIIRPDKLDELIGAVIDNNVHGMTVTEVRGFGRQFGQLAGKVDADLGLPENRKAALLPKIRLDLVVADDDAETIVEAIAKHARTETVGDGKIWVSTVDSAMRVRTGERGRDALLPNVRRPAIGPWWSGRTTL
jgi:nitrogen regulatory protein P-II 1